MPGLRGYIRVYDSTGDGVFVIVYGFAAGDAITLWRNQTIFVSTSPLYRFEKRSEKPFLYLQLEYFPLEASKGFF